MNKTFSAILVASSLSLVGCGNFNSISRVRKLGPVTSQFVDAKQRAVYVSNDKYGRSFSCAEPSPDALSAYAAALDAKVSTGKTAVGLSGASRESVASIGLRTQSIQLLRDTMFRNCEAAMNDLVDKNAYVIMQRRFQSVMVALLAIEQLTGATVAQQVILDSDARAGTLSDLASLQQTATDKKDLAVKAADAVIAKDGEITAAESDLALSPDDEDHKAKLKKLKGERPALVKKSSDADSEAKLALAALNAGASAAASAGGSGRFSERIAAGPWDPAKVKELGDAVKEIVKTTSLENFTSDQCQVILADTSDVTNRFGSNADQKYSVFMNQFLEYRDWCLRFLRSNENLKAVNVKSLEPSTLPVP